MSRNHDIFRQYTEMVEKKLEKFIEEEGLSSEDVFAACEKAMCSGEARWMTCLDYLTACTEYDSFIDLAFDHACMLGMGEPDEDEEWNPGEDAADEGDEAATAQDQRSQDGLRSGDTLNLVVTGTAMGR